MPSYELTGDGHGLLSLGATVSEAMSFAPRVPGGPVGTLVSRYRCLSCHRIGEEGGSSTAPLTFEGS